MAILNHERIMITATAVKSKLEKQIRGLILTFILALLVSGITAFPIEWQLSIATHWFSKLQWNNELTSWLELVYKGVQHTNSAYPFIAYGTDWLAFAHLVIAVAFIGPLREPIKNVWVIEFGIIACLGIFPLALIAGAIRGIPLFWTLIDCSFGFFGALLLWECHRKIKHLEAFTRIVKMS